MALGSREVAVKRLNSHSHLHIEKHGHKCSLLTTALSQTKPILSSTPLVPSGIRVKSSLPIAFWEVLYVQWALPTTWRSPLHQGNKIIWDRQCITVWLTCWSADYFMINQFVWSIKHQIILKNTFPELKLMSSASFFRPMVLNTANVCLKKAWNSYQNSWQLTLEQWNLYRKINNFPVKFWSALNSEIHAAQRRFGCIMTTFIFTFRQSLKR